MLETVWCSHNAIMCSPQACPGHSGLWSESWLFPGQSPAVTEAGGGQGPAISTREGTPVLSRRSASHFDKTKPGSDGFPPFCFSALTPQKPFPTSLCQHLLPGELTGATRDPSFAPAKVLTQWDIFFRLWKKPFLTLISSSGIKTK